MRDFQQVLTLLAKYSEPPAGPSPPTGATENDLKVLRDQLGFELPESLASWLAVCNGHLAGQGGLFGANHPNDFLDIGSRMIDGWRERRWIPVAGDGCGDYYILDASRTHLPTDGIYFVDQMDYGKLDYVVASELEIFLEQFLRDDLVGNP